MRTAESYFLSKENRRAGDQTKLFDEKFLVEGEISSPSAIILDKYLSLVYHSNMRLNELAKLMSTAGDESRLKILCVIFNKKKVCVSDIAKELNMSVAIVSHHLQVMAHDDLVISSREGKRICYELFKNPFVRDLKKFICKYK